MVLIPELCFTLQEEWLPNLVQLVFHSCIGGCDGCLNFEEKDNIGQYDIHLVKIK